MTEPKKIFLALPPEAIDEDAVKVVKRLKSQHHDAYLVGGGVRDLFLGMTPKDFDVATSARPEEVKSIFRNCRLIGKRFRLAHVHFRENKVIEVSTFRKTPQDSSDDDLMIRDDNAFGSEAEDALRRDFTINALFYDVDTQMIIDYVDGVDDLRDRRIKTIGDPVTRFREDPVRILRGAKFAARLRMTFDPEVERAVALVAPDILRCAPPRILEEILRMLRGGCAEASFKLLHSMGILEVILPDISRLLEQTQHETPIADTADPSKLTNNVPSSAEQLLSFLQKVDQYTRERGVALPDSVLLAALYWAPLEKAERAAQENGRRMDPQVLIRQVAGATLERLSVPRKTRDRLVRILAAQHRLQQRRRGKNTRPEILSRRDFFPDAVLLLSLRSRAQSNLQLAEQSTYWGRFINDPAHALPEDNQQPQLTSHQLPKTQQPRRTRRGRRGGKNRGPRTPQPNNPSKN